MQASLWHLCRGIKLQCSPIVIARVLPALIHGQGERQVAVGSSGIASALLEFRERLVQLVVSDQHEGQIVVGSLESGVNGDRLPQDHLRLSPTAL
jgi:hypothetical protein